MPDHEAEALDGLYDALMEPLPSPPSQADRLDALRATDTREDAFLRRNGRSVGQHAHLVRCLGVQGEVERAHAAFDRIAQMGKTPDNRAYAALMDACARAGDVPRAEAVIARMEEAGTPARADVWTGWRAVVAAVVARDSPRTCAPGLIKAHINSGAPPAEAAADAHAVLARARRCGVTEDAPMHSAIISGYLKARDAEGAEEVFDSMVIHNVQPDAVSFTQAPCCCCGRCSCCCDAMPTPNAHGGDDISARSRRDLGGISAISRADAHGGGDLRPARARAASPARHGQPRRETRSMALSRLFSRPFLGPFSALFSAIPIIIGCAYTCIRSCRRSRRTMRTICASRRISRRIYQVVPTIATHNAYLAVVANRCASLAGLSDKRREWLHKLQVSRASHVS